MNFSEYQQQAMRTAQYPQIGDNILYPLLGLGNEAGEAQGKMKKIMRDRMIPAPRVSDLTPDERNALAQELGDVLWYVAAVAHEINYDLTLIAAMNIEKLASRAARGTIKGSGDNR